MLVLLDQAGQRLVEFPLPAKDDFLLLQIGGKTQAMQLRPRRERPANIPGVGGAANRAMDQVQGIRNRIKHHPRAAKHTGALADRTGQAGFVASNFKRLCANFVNLGLALFEQFNPGHGVFRF
jgi:hypothetical protein